MAKYSFDKDKYDEWKRAQQESLELQKKMNTSITGYLEVVKEIGELQKNIKYIEEQKNKLTQEYVDSTKEVRKNWKELINARKRGDVDEVKALNKKDIELRKILASKKEALDITKHELALLQKQTDELSKQAREVSKIGLGLKSVVGFLGKTPDLIKGGFGRLKGTGIFDMDKEIRNATRSMAGGEKTYNRLFDTITRASDATGMWGVGVKDLAIMQQGYSEEISRSVKLTEDGFKAMAGLAEGTGLGKEFAVQMAGAMDKFNISAEQTSKIVEDNMNTAGQLGVNGAAALKSLQQNLKLAQRFTFKGGVKGLSEMSIKAARMRLDMDGIAGMAEKVFRPEGAIEMAANLATMGGEFAKLGDPMQLMFKARNDFEGFSNDIGKATKEFMKFNSKTGEFSIKSGLAADRMREISTMTGISVEKLQEMGEAQARMEEIGRGTGRFFSEDDLMTISSMAKFVEGKGFVVDVDGVEKTIKEIDSNDVKRMKAEKKSLEERAKSARTFDETITDLINQLKTFLLPIAQGLKEGLGDSLQTFMSDLKKGGFTDGLRDLGKNLAEFIKNLGGPDGFGKTLTKFANTLNNIDWKDLGDKLKGIVDIVYDVLTSKTTWFIVGGILATSIIGPIGTLVKGLSSVLSGGFKLFKGLFSSLGPMLKGTFNMVKSAGKGIVKTAGKVAGKVGAKALGKSLLKKIPGIGLIAGIAFAAQRAMSGDFSGAGLELLSGAASTLPGIGTGVSFGIDAGLAAKDMSNPDVEDGIVFHPQDKFMKVNDATMIAGTQAGGNAKLAETLSGKMNGGNSQVTHKFDDINVKIEIVVPGTSDLGVELAKDQAFIRRINEAISEQITMVIGGGKLSPNPKPI
jgi:hypothetical protein